LIEVGRELGLPESKLLKAIDDELRYGAFDETKEEIIEKRRKEWRGHLLWYIGVNTIIVVLHFAIGDSACLFTPFLSFPRKRVR
jgi:hypothetical protein